MAQKTNLNISPYFDDFAEEGIGAKDKNYYKILFNPGKPVQARELNTLQSILQNQIESFGSSTFKDGSVVIPGNIVYDNQLYAVKLNLQQYGVDISSYLEQFIGKKITGQVSGVTAVIQLVQLPNSEVEYPTLYIKYLDSDNNFQANPFQDNELLYASESVGIIAAGTPFASTILNNCNSISSAASIGDGIYFVRGTFAKVAKQTIILDYYTNISSYRIGLRIDEEIVSAKDDPYLYDNAQGFTNYAAPGADRFKISLILTKKLLTDTNDVNFIELLRIQNGVIKKIETKSNYSPIKDYLAQRTYDESGDYVVDPFEFTLNDSLNNRLGNNGIYFDNEKTDQGNVPSDDLMCIKLTPGKAYIKGYDIEKTGIEIVDVSKPRTKQYFNSVNIPFEMGNLLRVNNVSGAPKTKTEVYLQNRRKNSNSVAAGSTIGSARIYNFTVTDAAYTGNSTNWDLYLYDVQTYTVLSLNQSVSSTEVPATTFIKGKSSGASGYVVSAGNNTNIISVRQTSGAFSVGEKIIINGSELYSRTISSVRVYGIDDVKSVHQPTSISGFSTAFLSDTQLERVLRSEIITISPESGGISTATVSSPRSFTGIKSDTIIRYQRPGVGTEIYNRVVSISPSLTSIQLESVQNVSGICDGGLSTSQYSGNYSLGIPELKNEEKGFLYAEIPSNNVASVDLGKSTITFSAQSNSTFSVTGNTLTLNTGNFNLGINTATAKFEAFDEERYSIFYSDGTIENLTPDKFSITGNSDQITFSNIQNKIVSVINATFVKNGIQNKVKQFNRSKTLNVFLSKDVQSGTDINNSIGDGLTYSPYYGLRVQDEEISLNYPDVVKVLSILESLNSSIPVLDKLTFSSIVNVDSNVIIGENIIGKTTNCVARVVSKPSSNTLGIIYLNKNRFTSGENVVFEESNIDTNILSIILGNYKDITSKYFLNKGQKEQYYDYSKIVRRTGESSPSKQLLIVFDYYSVPSTDTGDVYTVNSYNAERFNSDIPDIGGNNIRASNTLDFRPRVSVFTGASSSPFDFSSRSFGTEPKLIMSPNESALIGYEVYLGRIDKLYLDRYGVFTVLQGVPSIDPKEPGKKDDVMELATITLPAYLFDPRDARISIVDNTRYTMRDIGKIEDRVENLERTTSLSLLELSTQNLQIQDAQGLNRFKTGFFVDDFKNYDLINTDLSTVEIDNINDELRPAISRNSINLKPVSLEDIGDESLDLNTDFKLFDSNVQKTGDAITLKYESVNWISQTFATKVENVNPFNVISYIGSLKLTPSSDSWRRTFRLKDIVINTISEITLTTRDRRNVGEKVSVRENIREIIRTGTEVYMRSRNTGFTVVNLKPLTRYYQFLDGASGVDFIPKLIEIAKDSSLQNYGSSSSFKVGETVFGYFNGSKLIRFRVAKSNHKQGPYNNPSIIYTVNPYLSSETIPDNYSSSSKVLNIDIESLCIEAQGCYSGYLITGMKLIGKTSGAVAYVKDLKLISDINGFLSGSFFLKNPNTFPPPPVRITTGSKIYKLTSSSNNSSPLPGSNLISSAETIYRSEGKWEERQRSITRITTKTNVILYCDPLAQSFTVSGFGDLNGNKPDEDINGVFITAVDLFFASKDPGNSPLTVEIRTMENGTPTRIVVGNSVTLRPADINISNNASVATKVTFDYPIFLEPNLEYAIVLLAPQSDQYEVWIGEMGEKTIETKNLPDSQVIRYSKQFAIGSLFKSQNGSIWTANQYQDLKFNLYKANFVSKAGSVLFHNPTLEQSNGYVPTLQDNPITILPKKIKIGITTITNSSLVGILTAGRKVSVQSASYKSGYIVGTGSSVSSVGLTTGGTNYSTGTVDTYNITGNGSGLKLNIVASGSITSVSITPGYFGSGYTIGDVVGIVTSTVSPVGGRDARITITSINNSVNTLYISNVQGSNFNVGSQLSYYDNSGNLISLANTFITSSTPDGGLYSGNYFKVNHFDHGMNSSTNKVIISNVDSDLVPTTLLSPITTSSSTISVASTSNFGTFEGKPVDGNNPGYVKIEDEIIKYESISTGLLGTLSRGIDSTLQINHDLNVPVYKYEIGGVSLRRINTTQTIDTIGLDANSYYVQFDRSTNGVNRNTDNTPSTFPELSFNTESLCGGSNVEATENIQFTGIIPHINALNPGSSTSITGQIRTVSGTSVNGSEISFIDQGYEDVEFDSENKLSSVRLVCSNVNELQYLTSLLRRKSFTMKVDLATTDSNLSPMIFWKQSSVEFLNNLFNNPIQDYVNDNRVNSIFNDPHAAVYVSNTIILSQPATSLKVILSAYRHSSANFRVLYSLIRPDSSEVQSSFELFPGYNNLTLDNNQDGYLDVVNTSENSGLSDVFVPASLDDQFLEYEFSANNIGSFTGYTIKIVFSGTNQAYVPRIKDLRSIALA